MWSCFRRFTASGPSTFRPMMTESYSYLSHFSCRFNKALKQVQVCGKIPSSTFCVFISGAEAFRELDAVTHMFRTQSLLLCFIKANVIQRVLSPVVKRVLSWTCRKQRFGFLDPHISVTNLLNVLQSLCFRLMVSPHYFLQYIQPAV